MAVDLNKYEVEFPVIDSLHAAQQADLLAKVTENLRGRGICAAALDTFIAMQNGSENVGYQLAIEVPADTFVDPTAVIESLRRAA